MHTWQVQWKVDFSIGASDMNIRKYNISMFQNSYQNGTFFQLFDPKLSQDKSRNLYKLQSPQANYKVFDKKLKTFIFELLQPSSKISFPKEDRKQLYLIQQYLNLQIEFSDADWHIQLTVNDLTRTKRRIILSPAVHKMEKKPFFVKFPCPPIRHGLWVNLCIDLHSFINGFKGQTYRSLDLIQIFGSIKLRRIYTTQHQVSEFGGQNQTVFLPKNFYFPPEIENQKYLIRFEENSHEESHELIQISTKSASHIASSKNIKKDIGSKKEIKDPKQEKAKTQKQTGKIKQKPTDVQGATSLKDLDILVQKPLKDERKFLANTNGLQSLKMKKQASKNQDNLLQTSKSNITPLSTGKALNKKREPSKTHNKKQKRSSIQNKGNIRGKQGSVKKNKVAESEKLNPWRSSTIKRSQTGRHQPVKQQEERKIQSAEATLFKTKNNLLQKESQLKGRYLDRNSDRSRQSDYFQMSQKFSTVTQTRFFKNSLALKNQMQSEPKQNHDEIEQNIEIETNSHYSNSNPNSHKKNKQNLFAQLSQKPIQESINDSLDGMTANRNGKRQCSTKPQLSENESYFNMSSRMGFGEKMMNKFMKQMQRPYSPPLGEREHTEPLEQHEPHVNQFQSEKGVEMIYDPVLNCYYDHKTHTYYELKN